MRIAIVTETYYPSTDGVVTRLTACVRRLIREGHEVMVIAPDKGITEHEGAVVRGIPAFRFFLYPDLELAYPRPLVGKLLREFDPDVVHVVNPAVLGAAGIWFGRSRPLIASFHTHVPAYADFYRLPWLKPILWRYLRALHNRADMNLCTSRTVLEGLRARGFRNVRLWEHGVDTGRFHPRHRSEAMRRFLTDGHPDDRLLLYVGRLAAEKSVERLRDVLLAADGIRLAVVGDGPHRRALEVHFAGTPAKFTGFLHGEALAQAYASSDLFVFPSTTETLGLVLLEAMASGLPPVAADLGPAREQIDDGRTGFLFDPAHPDGLTRTVLAALGDEARLRRTAGQARRTASDCGWDKPGRQLLDYYAETIRLKRRACGAFREEGARL
jgi:glycosyltransferase involved in cell wall biosynthesis